MSFSSDYQSRLLMEAGNLFKTTLWEELLKGLAEKRKLLVDQLETTRINDEKKIFDLARIQGQLSGLDECLWILKEIINEKGELPFVTKADFPRL